MNAIDQAKKICKEHGVKGFRKLKLKRPLHVVGRQTFRINKHIALRLLNKLESEGFRIDNHQVVFELAEKGHLDSFTIHG